MPGGLQENRTAIESTSTHSNNGPFQPGDRVAALWESSGVGKAGSDFFSATVRGYDTVRSLYDLLYDDGGTDDAVPVVDVRGKKGAISRSKPIEGRLHGTSDPWTLYASSANAARILGFKNSGVRAQNYPSLMRGKATTGGYEFRWPSTSSGGKAALGEAGGGEGGGQESKQQKNAAAQETAQEAAKTATKATSSSSSSLSSSANGGTDDAAPVVDVRGTNRDASKNTQGGHEGGGSGGSGDSDRGHSHMGRVQRD